MFNSLFFQNQDNYQKLFLVNVWVHRDVSLQLLIGIRTRWGRRVICEEAWFDSDRNRTGFGAWPMFAASNFNVNSYCKNKKHIYLLKIRHRQCLQLHLLLFICNVCISYWCSFVCFTFIIITGVPWGKAEVVLEVSALVQDPGGAASDAEAILVQQVLNRTQNHKKQQQALKNRFFLR